MSYSMQALDRLEACANSRDRIGYYKTLIDLGDPYGAMALGVVTQSTLSGIVARRYAFSVSRRCCRPMNEDIWLDISLRLMRSDYLARRSSISFEKGAPSLLWHVIRDYHVLAFGYYSLPPFTWTAWIPLQLDGPDKDQKLWHQMLTEQFIVISCQVAGLCLNRIARKEGIKPHTLMQATWQLQTSPPLVTGSPPNPRLAACMSRLARYLQPGASATSNEKLAIFYLKTLSEDPNSISSMMESSLFLGLGVLEAMPLPPPNFPQTAGALSWPGG